MGTLKLLFSRDFGAGCAAALFLGATAFCSNARAVIILPNQNKTPTGTETIGGTTLATDSNVAFTGTDALSDTVFTGTITSMALTDSSTGDMDFLYQFTNNANSIDTIEHLTVGGFTGFTTDADFTPGTGIAPGSLTRSSSGYNIDFQFPGSGAVAQGESSDVLFVKTNATAYTTGNAVVQDGGNGNVAVLVPTVPEPATIAVGALALGGLCIRRRRQ